MAEQQNLFPPNPHAASPTSAQESFTPLSWAARVEAAVRFVVRFYLGLLVMVLPWLNFWTQNNLFTYSRTLIVIADNGFVRGVVSGLGLLLIVLAAAQAASTWSHARAASALSRRKRHLEAEP